MPGNAKSGVFSANLVSGNRLHGIPLPTKIEKFINLPKNAQILLK